MSPPGRRLITVLTLTAAVASGAALIVPDQAVARDSRGAAPTGKPACSSAVAHHTPRAHACSPSRRQTASGDHTKTHTAHTNKRTGRSRRGKRRSTKHAVRKVTRKTGHAATGGATVADQAKAKCEDGSTPVRTAPGSFACDDDSEPSCEGGSYPIVSANGATLLCDLPPRTGSGSGATPVQPEPEDAICEDGTAPYAQDGWFACDDGSEPFCEQGANLTVSNDGSMLECVAEEDEE